MLWHHCHNNDLIVVLLISGRICRQPHELQIYRLAIVFVTILIFSYQSFVDFFLPCELFSLVFGAFLSGVFLSFGFSEFSFLANFILYRN